MGERVTYTLKKSEILSHTKSIEYLFKENSIVKSFPLILLYHNIKSELNQTKVLFSVSKKKFKKATDRNRIKRLLRENYRLLKIELNKTLPSGKNSIALIYVGNELPTFKDVEKSTLSLIQKLSEKSH